jgi:eukaryotic-like serine/threonine-protein kinase
VSPSGPTGGGTRLERGSRLGPYEILGPLGAGGMGEVYRALDSRLGREVAIKVLPAESSTDPDRLKRFEQESKAAGALNHPNLLAVFDTGVHEGGPYIVFELLQGETLRQRLAPGPLPTRKAVECAVQIANGLAAAHQAGIVHRDLKPENVFVTEDGRVKILDFGLAKLQPRRNEGDALSAEATASEITGAGTVLGTVGYMSPEQVQGRPADPRSDIFSLGTLFYEMLSGRRAFARDSSIETLRAILKEDPAELSGVKGSVPSGLEQIVRRCLEKRPDERFQSARDVAFALEAVSGSRAGMGFETPRPVGRRLVVGAAALTVVVLAASTVWLWPAASPPRVTGTTQITSDLVAKFWPVTDGSRIYFNESPRAGASVLAQVAAIGGDVAHIAAPFSAPQVVDVSPDGSELLVLGYGEVAPQDGMAELWIVPVVGGPPRRVGDLRGQDAAWSIDGRNIAYAAGSDLHVASSDGSGSRKIWTAAASIHFLAWSRDGRRLRMTVFPKNRNPALWEIGADGEGPHSLLPAFDRGACCGRWAADGKSYVFSAWEGRISDIWVLPERTSWLSRTPAEPVRLTQGPLSLNTPAPSRDGRRIFVVGEKERGELVRYDPGSRQFLPYLSGISAYTVRFSLDGQWLAYTAYPEGTLWRSRADGSDRLQLTRPPLHADDAHWSPDGKRLVFFGWDFVGQTNSSYLVSADGGLPALVPMPHDQGLVANSWSPDGGTLALWQRPEGRAITIQLLDLKTGRLSTVPGSEGLLDPHWSPDGRYLTAQSSDYLRLSLYDFTSRRWRQLLAGKQVLGWAAWSRDSRSLFINEGPARVRLGIADGRREVLANVEGLRLTGNYANWVGNAPDDSVITLRDLSVQEIFALDWKAP